MRIRVPMHSSLDFPLAPKTFAGNSRKAEAGAAFHWLQQGGFLFLAQPWLWLLAATLSLSVIFFYLWLPAPLGFLPLLTLPMLQAGMQRVSRELCSGRPSRFSDLLAGFRTKTGGLALIGLTTALLLAGGLWCCKILAGSATGPANQLLTGLLALLLAVPVLLASLFAPALHFFNDMPPWQAMRASFNACIGNWLALAIFAILSGMLLLLALLSAGLGFCLLIPVMNGALFAAYRDIFPGT